MERCLTGCVTTGKCTSLCASFSQAYNKNGNKIYCRGMLKGCNELISRIISQTDYCLAWKRGSAPVSTLTHAIAAVAFVVKCREDTSFNALPCSMEARVQNYCLCDCGSEKLLSGKLWGQWQGIRRPGHPGAE